MTSKCETRLINQEIQCKVMATMSGGHILAAGVTQYTVKFEIGIHHKYLVIIL